ncbi:DNA topoisomerase IB [Altererythrobacter aurantiacus]|uniref:DNA topoisomerase n=1 Tax=Parapontixanthobacter aurantiacus TaxID=1463599 RepID=A0A844ZDQ6_9SPHN|nr:DNA topoisomerase IB [Parapontixanthobacter aurantiacus]MXO85080.1 DNA topoisomerase IB [Parapontixanthobacter aurantiacus]
MASEPQHLIYVDDDLPGITRKRAGTGWAYYDPKGTLIRDRAEKRRLNAIALPPAYTDAWFCPADNGHILATGYDAAGRKQYRYHPDFRTMRESEKFDGCLAFGNLLPLVRKKVEDDMKARKLTRRKVVATVVRLLDRGAVRVGNDTYTRSNQSYGATTLQRNHVEVNGTKLVLHYPGKSGKERHVEFADKSLSRVIKRLQDLEGQRLFQFRDDDGELHAIDSGDVNDYIREATGQHFTAKNFRTWHGSVLAYNALFHAKERLTLKVLLEAVAERLGNTPAVTRRSYIHPAVIAQVDGQEAWRETERLPRSTKYLSREERGLIAMLEQSPAASELLAA